MLLHEAKESSIRIILMNIYDVICISYISVAYVIQKLLTLNINESPMHKTNESRMTLCKGGLVNVKHANGQYCTCNWEDIVWSGDSGVQFPENEGLFTYCFWRYCVAIWPGLSGSYGDPSVSDIQVLGFQRSVTTLSLRLKFYVIPLSCFNWFWYKIGRSVVPSQLAQCIGNINKHKLLL